MVEISQEDELRQAIAEAMKVRWESIETAPNDTSLIIGTVRWLGDGNETVESLRQNWGRLFLRGKLLEGARVIAWRRPMPWEVPYEGKVEDLK